MNRAMRQLDKLFEKTKAGFHRKELVPWSHARWGRGALDVIKATPWELLLGDAPSCGYKRVSQLADYLGQPRRTMERLCWWVWWLMTERKAHTWIRISSVREDASKEETLGYEPSAEEIEEAIKYGVEHDVLTVVIHSVGHGDVAYMAARSRSMEETDLATDLSKILDTRTDRNGEGVVGGWIIQSTEEAHRAWTKSRTRSSKKPSNSTPVTTGPRVESS